MELEETAYWLELLAAAQIIPAHRLESLLAEADELLAILTASAKSAKRLRK